MPRRWLHGVLNCFGIPKQLSTGKELLHSHGLRPLGRIICAVEGPYHPLDDEAMLQAADEVEEAAAAAAGGAAGGVVAEEAPPAPAAPAPPAGGAGLLLRAGHHRATVVPELASRLIQAQTVGLGWL